VKELNPYWEMMRTRLSNLHGTGTDMGSIWDVRLTELTVNAYLFNDVLITKETNLVSKLVGKVNVFELKGARLIGHTGKSIIYNFLRFQMIQNIWKN
jgi:hypothetical protein